MALTNTRYKSKDWDAAFGMKPAVPQNSFITTIQIVTYIIM
jgi:hypothetical protein